MTVAELPPWRRGTAPPPNEPAPDESEPPAREIPPWPDWTPPAPPTPERPFPLAHQLTQAHTAERYARELYEGYRDGLQYEESGQPSLQQFHDEWQEAVRRREALERQVARALGEAGR